MASFVDQKILLGVSGSIAAYKAAEWTRALSREGAEVTVVMTEAAGRFVSPLTFAALSGRQVHSGMFAMEAAEQIPHINLARETDCILVAPATAQTIARLAHGLADDLLSTVVLATESKVVICPAMNSKMYQHPATQANLARLRTYGYRVVEPACGQLACGDQGPGRLADWSEVRQAVLAALAPQDLAGLRVLITAGPTWEPIDPARLLSNRSTGRMGFALAGAAGQRGAAVTLVSGPTSLEPPPGVETVAVTTAREMHEAVMAKAREMDVIVMAAAVSDYRPATAAEHKLKKGGKTLELSLVANPDILAELGEQKLASDCFPLLVGFAAESQNHLAEGMRKLNEKHLDLIAVNDISANDQGFAAETNRIVLIDRNGTEEELPLMSKEQAAHRLWNAVVRLLKV